MNKLKNIESLITSGEKLGLAKGYDVCNKEEIMKEIKELIEKEVLAIEKIHQKEIASILDTNLGVSNWKEIGKKYGFWDYFKKQLIEEIIPIEQDRNISIYTKPEYYDGWNACIKYINSKLPWRN